VGIREDEKEEEVMAFRSCSMFRIHVASLSASIARARTAIIEGGGSIDGDDERGHFSGETPVGGIDGTYTTEGNDILVTITRKPFLLVTCKRIEDEVRGFFR